jgi:Anaphase promoting complex subunit 8 / Cdc23.
MDASSNMTTSGMSMSMDTTAINDPSSLCTPSNLPSTPKRFSTVKAASIVWDLEEARANLRNATQILSKYGLKLASRWAAEQLNALAPPRQGTTTTSSTSSLNVSCSVLHSEFLKSGNDLEYYAKSVMDVGDYHRAAFILSNNNLHNHNDDQKNAKGLLATGKKSIGTNNGDLMIYPPRDSLTSYGFYLRAYSLYMAGERRKEEEVLELR